MRLRPSRRARPPGRRLRPGPRLESQVRNRWDRQGLQKILHGKGEYLLSYSILMWIIFTFTPIYFLFWRENILHHQDVCYFHFHDHIFAVTFVTISMCHVDTILSLLQGRDPEISHFPFEDLLHEQSSSPTHSILWPSTWLSANFSPIPAPAATKFRVRIPTVQGDKRSREAFSLLIIPRSRISRASVCKLMRDGDIKFCALHASMRQSLMQNFSQGALFITRD